MQREWLWAFAAAGAFAAGVVGAESYARLVAPAFTAAATLIASAHPWTVREVVVTREGPGQAAVLRLTGEVRRYGGDPKPAALVLARVAVGEVIETPLIFWTLLLLWPAGDVREWLLRAALGVGVFLGLEIALTGCQLLHSLADASAVLEGDRAGLSLWGRWSRFIEAGGGFVLEVSAALLTVAAVQRLRRPRGTSASSAGAPASA
jgi:hypothetical protein